MSHLGIELLLLVMLHHSLHKYAARSVYMMGLIFVDTSRFFICSSLSEKIVIFQSCQSRDW